MRHVEKALERMTDKSFIELENIEERISRVWSPVSHLNGVMDSDELRLVYQKSLGLLTEYHSEIGQNQALYSQYKKLRDNHRYSELSAARKKVIENNLLDFSLSGAELKHNEKARLREINLELSRLSNQFEQNLLDSTQAWKLLITTESSLSGLPQSTLDIAQQAAAAEDKDGWLFSLQTPSYLAVMQHALS